MESQVPAEETNRPGGGDGQVPDPAVQGGRGVQGRRAEHRAQRGDLPRRAQQDGRLRQADVPRLRHRPDRDGHLQGLLQVHKITLKTKYFTGKLLHYFIRKPSPTATLEPQ